MFSFPNTSVSFGEFYIWYIQCMDIISYLVCKNQHYLLLQCAWLDLIFNVVILVYKCLQMFTNVQNIEKGNWMKIVGGSRENRVKMMGQIG